METITWRILIGERVVQDWSLPTTRMDHVPLLHSLREKYGTWAVIEMKFEAHEDEENNDVH